MIDYLGFLVEKALVGAQSQDEVQSILQIQKELEQTLAPNTNSKLCSCWSFEPNKIGLVAEYDSDCWVHGD